MRCIRHPSIDGLRVRCDFRNTRRHLIRETSAQTLIPNSNSFVSISLAPSPQQQTPTIKRSLNPTYPAAQSTFDFPLYASLAEGGLYRGRGVEVVVWDKDLVKKDYMGEVAVPLAQWFEGAEGVVWDEQGPQREKPFELVSARRRRRVTGRVMLQFGLVLPDDVPREERERRGKEILRDLESKGERHMACLMDVPAVGAPPCSGTKS